jgi:hypothetical protein
MKQRTVNDLHVSVRRQTLNEWISGTCELTVIDDGVFGTDESGESLNVKGYGYSITAESRGLQKPIRFEPIHGGTFGGF